METTYSIVHITVEEQTIFNASGLPISNRSTIPSTLCSLLNIKCYLRKIRLAIQQKKGPLRETH